MASTTSTVTINAAFLQEIKEDNRELKHLLAEVRALTSRPRPTVSLAQVQDLLARLRDQLAMHFALEEAFGYFDDPVAVAPRLCREVTTLRAQHSEMYLKICDLVAQAEQAAETRQRNQLRHLLAELREFCVELRAHEERENEVIMKAFNDEIGVGD